MKPAPLLILGAIALTACASSAPDPSLQILAKINDESVTVTELRDQFVKRHGGHTKFLGGEVELEKFLNIVIDQRLLIQEAYELGLQDKSEVRIATDAYREDKAVEYLVKSELEQKAIATAEEVRQAWQKNTSTMVQVRQIAVDTRQAAEEIRTALLHGADFDAMARQCSFAQSRIRGGRLTPFGWGTMDPAWEEAVFKLEPGEIAPVFHTPEGWQIVQLEDKTELRAPEFAKAAPRIEAILKKRKLDQRKKEFSNELWTKYHVEWKQGDRSPRMLIKLQKTAPDAPIATWDGGSLAAKDVLSDVELHMLSLFPPERAAVEIDSRLRMTINEPLVKLEAKVRKTAEVHEVAEDTRMFQEERMESLLYDDHILKDVTVAEDDVRNYFGEHQKEFVAPERRKISHIVVESEDAAKKIRDQITSGEDFVTLVKSKSHDAEAARTGGDLGWITPKEVPAEFADVLKLREGEVSQPVQSKFGWHLIKVVRIEPERPLTFEEAKGNIRKVVLEKKQREKRAYWVKKLRDAATIRVNKRAIRAFVRDHQFNPDATPPQHGAK